ncbi:MAG: ABC transporter ATP-binding protein [Candidatus Tectomicrobia bacterium]|uniref:ABC transporter ATP-binding protein n=1 Tax=Tectimicrobiota bacterium TaxID=2528274 RepID=A0A932GQ11_UNCTE|nr:ABC transporter ATP-binding protein [Candidatus Tectomicrobia bacterium]
MHNDDAIVVSDLSVQFAGIDRTTALESVSFNVRHGEFVAIVGPSGCGKSTLLKVIARLLAPSRGTVAVHGEQAGKLRVGFVFQSDALLPWRTAVQNVELAVRLAGGDKHNASARAHHLMEELRLGDSCDKYPSQLSGGMRKRVSLARALAQQPSVFLMDEPFSALDAQTRIHVGNFFLRILEESKQTVVLVTHDIEEAVALADRVLVMSQRPGEIAASFEIPLPRPRDYHATRFVQGFQQLQQRVWDTLGYGATNGR